MGSMIRVLLVLFWAGASFATPCGPLTNDWTDSPINKIYSSEVEQNFADVVACSDDVEQRMTTAESTISTHTSDIATNATAITAHSTGSSTLNGIARFSDTLGDIKDTTQITINDAGTMSTASWSVTNVGALAITSLTVGGTFIDGNGIDLAPGDRYEINDVVVLSATGIGSGVLNSSLQTLGTLTSLTVSGAANLSVGPLEIPNGTTKPATCAVGDIFLESDQPTSEMLFACEVTNTWVLQSGVGGGGGLDNIVEDTTPQLGGSLDVNTNPIVSTSNGDITLTPNGTGDVVINGTTWSVDTAGAATFTSVDVDAPASASGSLTIKEGADKGSNTYQFRGLDAGWASNIEIVWPDDAAPGTGEILGIASVAAGVITLEWEADDTGTGISLNLTGNELVFNPPSILSGACATAITDTATGAIASDVVSWSPQGDISAVTGYAPVTTGGVSVFAFAGTDLVSFVACNPTESALNPDSITINWRVAR